MTTHRRIGFAGLVVPLLALLTACGGNAIEGLGSRPSAATSSSGGTARQGVRPPAASGKIAEIDGDVVQVQNDETGQVAVRLTSKTTYTQTTSATRAAVTVGSCIRASSPSSSASAQPTAITATEVFVTPATNGRCERAFGGAAGGGGPVVVRPSGAAALPSGALPSGAPTNHSGRTAFGAGISGVVTRISGSVITVRAERPDGGTFTATVTVTSTTKYTATTAATRAAVKVGLCAVAQGSTGSDGSVTATRLALSPARSDGCGQLIRRGPGTAPTGGATR